MEDFLRELQEKMAELTEKDNDNFIEEEGGIRIYDPPILGVASASDPMFSRFKEDENIIGEKFQRPEEWMSSAKSVITYFLPFSEKIRKSNYPDTNTASVPWLHSRFQGEYFNEKIRSFVVDELKKQNGEAISPALEKGYIKDLENLDSNWSERHVAFVAGLGTFSLSKSLITEKGTAGRFGSVITNIKIEPGERKFEHKEEFCLFHQGGKCNKCAKRCPSGAISENGKDKSICYDHLFVKDLLKKERDKFGYPYSPCGKCQTKVPCENKIPGR